MPVACGQVAHHAHLQLRRRKGRGHIDPAGFFGQSQQVLIVTGRGQRGGEQRGGVGITETAGQKGRGHYVTQTQCGVITNGEGLLARHIEQRVRAKGLAQAAEQHGIHIELQ